MLHELGEGLSSLGVLEATLAEDQVGLTSAVLTSGSSWVGTRHPETNLSTIPASLPAVSGGAEPGS